MGMMYKASSTLLLLTAVTASRRRLAALPCNDLTWAKEVDVDMKNGCVVKKGIVVGHKNRNGAIFVGRQHVLTKAAVQAMGGRAGPIVLPTDLRNYFPTFARVGPVTTG